ncbi:hypothetical protein CC78DRAFT_544164 [Lojkania enalia]|uniref:AA1-like domain-containing protein n=1 Tax=Lojkania enalia TaxID=147567 RepID=A0A9P4KDC0_9PLEO|nr:hypothetical protein CC78DRAFT_544164 [Didymosphaeria enalia]
MFTTPFLALLFSSLTLAIPTHRIRKDVTPIAFIVTKFAAFDSASPSLSFTLEDPNPNHPLTTTCSLPKTAPSLFADKWYACKSGMSDAAFRYKEEGTFEVKRGWTSGSSNSIYLTAFAPEGTYWAEGVNMTKTDEGVEYVREEPWKFTVTSMSG